MLKALELVGFKSFADRTRFEFPSGITCVVGPNGSGKSNVVDAVKWVLGEQSVKSLRGKEMADVIFNGSGSRPPLNAAEATLTFDNTQRLLAIDTVEVHITRRVYRSGEGEYFINRQPCRLRDIRELFSGTGMATEAYSVIEQGKVDVLLQSSPRDRRMIFEEAAGISRFKTKKIESLRRLERVDQNLLRLSDIVAEVEGRLKTVRTQAAKARRYKEHVDRLQELRTQVGLADWRSLSQQLSVLDAEISTLAQQRQTVEGQLELVEAQALEVDRRLLEAQDALRASERHGAEVREQIAAGEADAGHGRARLRDLEEEVARHRGQLAAMSLRADDLRRQLTDTFEALAAAETQHAEVAARLVDDEQTLAAITSELTRVAAESELARKSHLEAVRAAAALANQIAALETSIAARRSAAADGQRQLDELNAAFQSLEGELVQLRRADEELAAAAQSQQAALVDSRRHVARLRESHAAHVADLNQLRQRHAGASERASVLEDLENRLDGLQAGVKDVLLSARHEPDGPFRHVRGLVADVFRASVELAPLVDVALGERAQYLVVQSPDGRHSHDELLAYLQRASSRWKGRVGFLLLEATTPAPAEPPSADEQLAVQQGVVGRLDRLLDVPAGLEPLARVLLGQTWIVEQLSDARRLAATTGRRLSFVTRAGELLAADGALSVGPRQATLGLVSRRSELRSLRDVLAQFAAAIAAVQEALAELQAQLAAEEQRTDELELRQRESAAALEQHRARVSATQLHLTQVDQQRQAVAAELAAIQHHNAHDEAALAQAGHSLSEAEAQAAAIEGRISAAAARQHDLARQRHDCQQRVTAVKVELAKSEERISHLRARLAQCERDQQDRQRAIRDGRQQVGACMQRMQAAELTILAAQSQVATLYLLKERLAAETAALVVHREAELDRKTLLMAQAQKLRSAAHKLEERQHAQELAAGAIRHERATLADRLREDYAIDLAALDASADAEELQRREEIEQEIADLRRKVQNIGHVNLDALDELDQLEARFGTLSSQYDDLAKAKALLEQIIGKINADSRRLFAETLETVRGYFQGLFRKLFGGGQADIVLEEGADILDSGIEIVARPPGKEPRSISLLSGGEKTLTCVALLLAIFQYRPSPFCVLDEVDAALDEANIERFIAVLQEFLAWTQFIVVTHSKKTMTCATTLYGVTMQESGISKRVSVRFEDISDEGKLRAGAGDAEEEAA